MCVCVCGGGGGGGGGKFVLTPCLSVMLTSASLLTRYSTVSVWPPSAARCRSVT